MTNTGSRGWLDDSLRDKLRSRETSDPLADSLVRLQEALTDAAVQAVPAFLVELEKLRAKIETAGEADSTTKSELIANLKKKYGGDLTTEFVVDPALLGGMRIRVGSDVWDGTVRNRLERLQQEL